MDRWEQVVGRLEIDRCLRYGRRGGMAGMGRISIPLAGSLRQLLTAFPWAKSQKAN